jgi:hypothetical protein
MESFSLSRVAAGYDGRCHREGGAVPTAEELAALRALVSADFRRHKELMDAIPAGGLEDYSEVIGAAFYLAVRMQFPKRYSAEEVIRLVAETRASVDLTGDVVDPRVGELVVRSALGEDRDKVAEVPDDKLAAAETAICAYLAHERRLGDPDDFMRKVEQLLDEWADDDSGG